MTGTTRQSGAVLLMSLILLLMMTVFAISAVNMGNLGLKVVGNMQNQKTMDSSAQQALEQVISRFGGFGLTPAAQTISVNNNSVAVAAPVCVYSTNATGYSAAWGLAPQDNIWHISATVTDNASGATATITQGVQIRMLAGNCPTPTAAPGP